MKLRKSEIMSKIQSGASLVKKFDRMYGTYFFLNDIDGHTIYNVHLGDCKSIANSNLVKTMLDSNTFEFTMK
jgi:hypothetical protein